MERGVQSTTHTGGGGATATATATTASGDDYDIDGEKKTFLLLFCIIDFVYLFQNRVFLRLTNWGSFHSN